AADHCLLDPRLLGGAPVPALPSTCPCSPHPSDSSPRAATRSSSWLRLFLAQTLSQTSSLQPCAFRRGWCKNMKRTRDEMSSCYGNPNMLYYWHEAITY